MSFSANLDLGFIRANVGCETPPASKSFVRSAISWATAPYQNSWNKFQKHQHNFKDSAETLENFERRLSQLRDETLPIKRRQLATFERLKPRCEALVPPSSSWNVTKWRAVRYFTGNTPEEKQLDRLNDNIGKIKDDIFNLELERDLTLEGKDLMQLAHYRDNALRVLAATQLVGLVAGSVFASLAVLSFFSTTGLTAFVLAGTLSIPTLIFHDIYYVAGNVENCLDTRGIIVASAFGLRVLARIALDAAGKIEINPDSEGAFTNLVDTLAETVHSVANGIIAMIGDDKPTEERNLMDLAETCICELSKETVLIYPFRSQLKKPLYDLMNQIMS